MFGKYALTSSSINSKQQTNKQTNKILINHNIKIRAVLVDNRIRFIINSKTQNDMLFPSTVPRWMITWSVVVEQWLPSMKI